MPSSTVSFESADHFAGKKPGNPASSAAAPPMELGVNVAALPSGDNFPTKALGALSAARPAVSQRRAGSRMRRAPLLPKADSSTLSQSRSEEHTSELQSLAY